MFEFSYLKAYANAPTLLDGCCKIGVIEKKHHVSTVRACVVVAVGFDDFKWAYNSVFHLCPMTVYVIDF